MLHSEYNTTSPEAFRVFVEGVENLQDYLRTNTGKSLQEAEKQLDESLAADPDFSLARYYKALVLTHSRRAEDAIGLFESLRQEGIPFKTEVLYNLAFAYARKYEYKSFERALKLLDEASESVPYDTILGVLPTTKRPDLVLLIQAMRAWVMAAFAGRPYKREDDFEGRRAEFLPGAEQLAKSVLKDRRLKKLVPETRTAVQVEAHNVLGITYMRMGQYSRQFEKNENQYWELSESNYEAALKLHSQDVRVLDNLSTLNLIRASYAFRRKEQDEVVAYAEEALETEEKAIFFNPHDRFRWLTKARAYVLLHRWKKAETAADRILHEPGAVTAEEVASLKEAIDTGDVASVVEKYPIEAKSSAK